MGPDERWWAHQGATGFWLAPAGAVVRQKNSEDRQVPMGVKRCHQQPMDTDGDGQPPIDAVGSNGLQLTPWAQIRLWRTTCGTGVCEPIAGHTSDFNLT